MLRRRSSRAGAAASGTSIMCFRRVRARDVASGPSPLRASASRARRGSARRRAHACEDGRGVGTSASRSDGPERSARRSRARGADQHRIRRGWLVRVTPEVMLSKKTLSRTRSRATWTRPPLICLFCRDFRLNGRHGAARLLDASPLRQRKALVCRTNGAAGATGLEPATSGVTGRSWRFRPERG